MEMISIQPRCDGDPSYCIPASFCAPFGSYPNPLHLTDDDRKQFAPVVQFPVQTREDGRQVPNYRVMDHTAPLPDQPVQLVSIEAFLNSQQRQRKTNHSDKVNDNCKDNPVSCRDWTWFGVGRYDENRMGMYESDLFRVENTQEQRTVHVGIDLDGPVGTPVHAFYYGTVHSVGYNPELGDYGHVIVVHHDLPPNSSSSVAIANASANGRQVYALYGHLNESVVHMIHVGDKVQTGQVLGSMGAFWENGGWTIPHVHFQLSLQPPKVPHDLPGAVAPKDRPAALWDFPDPRYVLGALY